MAKRTALKKSKQLRWRGARQKMGYRFEKYISRLFSENGFQVWSNPKIANPRQTDLLAKDGVESFLIEIKHVKRALDISDIDNLRSRLIRTSTDITGVIIATSDFTNNAIRETEESRAREILVFGPSDVKGLLDRRIGLKELIDRKREALRTRGKVWFFKPIALRYQKTKLPSGTERFAVGKQDAPYLAVRTDHFGGALFVRELPDTGWGNHGSEGATLVLRLELADLSGLAGVLGLLHEKFGLTGHGCFAIHQDGMSWFGTGARQFVEAVGQWATRYKESGLEKLHHSESLQFFDRLHDGWLVISADQRVNHNQSTKSVLDSAHLAIQLRGVPVDSEPFLQLCKYTHNRDARFEYVAERLMTSIRLKKPVALKVIGHVTERGNSARTESWVKGVVVQNPFFGKTFCPKEFSEVPHFPWRGLVATKSLICDLKDWYAKDSVVDKYLLLGFEATWAYDTPVIRPLTTWNKMIKQTPNKADRFSEVKASLKKMEEDTTFRKSINTVVNKAIGKKRSKTR